MLCYLVLFQIRKRDCFKPFQPYARPYHEGQRSGSFMLVVSDPQYLLGSSRFETHNSLSPKTSTFERVIYYQYNRRAIKQKTKTHCSTYTTVVDLSHRVVGSRARVSDVYKCVGSTKSWHIGPSINMDLSFPDMFIIRVTNPGTKSTTSLFSLKTREKIV